MANALVGWPRYTAEAVFSSESAFDPAYPVTNIGRLPFAKVGRTDETQALTITATFARKRLIELCVLGRHNLIANDAKVRWRLYEDVEGTQLLHDSDELKVWPATKTLEQVTWDSGNLWDRTYTAEEKEGYPFYSPYFVPGLLYVRRVDMMVSAPTHIGTVDIGLIELASAYRFPVNLSIGAQYGFRVRSEVEEADGGVEYFERKDKSRLLQGEVPYALASDAKAGFFEFQRQTDVTEPFFFWLDRDDKLNMLRDAYMARNDSLGLLGYATHDRHSIPINFKELL